MRRETAKKEKRYRSGRLRVWQLLLEENGLDGQIIEGGLVKHPKLEIQQGCWTITVEHEENLKQNYTTHITRFYAPFDSNGDFRLKVYKEGFFSTIGKIFGMQDIIVGDEKFDELFIVKGNNEGKLKNFFSNEKIVNLLIEEPLPHLEILDNEGAFGPQYDDGCDLVFYEIQEDIRDRKKLLSVIDLLNEILCHLCQIGCANEISPKLKRN